MSSRRGRGHGGRRENAGRRPWNHGRGRGQPSLATMFSNQNNSRLSSSSSSSQRRRNIREEPTPRVQDVRPPRTTTTQTDDSGLNYDAGESPFDDSVLHRGKKMGGENLKKQTQMIMDVRYRVRAVKMIQQDGVLWDMPP